MELVKGDQELLIIWETIRTLRQLTSLVNNSNLFNHR